MTEETNLYEIPEEDDAVAQVDEPSIEEESFNAGLNEALGNQPVVEDAKTLIAGMSEDELLAILEKAKRVDTLEERLSKTHDTAFGKIGSLEQTLKELKDSRQSTASASPTQLTKDNFPTLAAYLDDDDMTAALAEDLSKLVLGGTTQQVDSSQFEETLSKMRLDFEMKLLATQHPDWIEVANTDEFSTWMQSLKPDAQKIVNESNDAVEMSKAFTAFKSWRNKKTEKQALLENAIPTSTMGGSSKNMSASDPFLQGLRSAGVKNV